MAERDDRRQPAVGKRRNRRQRSTSKPAQPPWRHDGRDQDLPPELEADTAARAAELLPRILVLLRVGPSQRDGVLGDLETIAFIHHSCVVDWDGMPTVGQTRLQLRELARHSNDLVRRSADLVRTLEGLHDSTLARLLGAPRHSSRLRDELSRPGLARFAAALAGPTERALRLAEASDTTLRKW
jgi:hypothetical protein